MPKKHPQEVNDFLYAKPYGNVGKDIYNTALVRERCFFQNRKIFHHSVANNILNNLIDKIYLSAVKACAVEILCKRFLCGIHIKSDNTSYKFAERYGAAACFIIFF